MKCNDWDPDPLLALGLPLKDGDEVCCWWLGGKACRLYNHGPCETEGRPSLPEQVQCPELDSGKVLISEITGSYNIMLADDHVMFREAVRRIIESIADAKVVGEASDGFELLELLKKISPQLIILDISMPNLRGLEATREIKNINPAVKVLILTMHKDYEYVNYAFSARADGYLLKEDSQSELLLAIDTLRSGRTYLSPLLSTKLVDLHVQKIFRPATELLDSPRDLLTIREQEIIKLIAEGKSSKEIAGLLFISALTVKNHRAKIKKKLKVSKNADLVKYAIQKGYAILEL